MRLRLYSNRIITSSIFLGVIFVLIVRLHHLVVVQDFETKIVAENIPAVDVDTKLLAEPGLPLRLRIPKINIDAEIEYVNLTSTGEMGVPKDTRNVGWYEPGVRPGNIGNAVIAGHYGWNSGTKSAFDELHKLRIGDRIYTEDDTGATISYIVRENRRYNTDDDASHVFNSPDDRSHLNLIACDGDWDEVSKSYSQRLVVFTDRE